MSELLILPVLNRLDNTIKQLIAILAALGVPTAPPAGGAITIVTTTPRLSNRYKIITVDLNVVHTDIAIGIKDLKPTTGYATYVTILTIGAAFTFRVNSAAQDAITGALGLEISDFEISEIFISNAAGGAGTQAQFYLEYRVD
ncbi:hypothetical protein MUP59_01995 [Candidatus Bathyarchaeota archaeon]|nr:hypothetical protein [Candidatus Bathyarchaeota archaeon]